MTDCLTRAIPKHDPDSICNALKIKRLDHVARDRCKLHEGNRLAGPASQTCKTARYSKYSLPEQLRERLEFGEVYSELDGDSGVMLMDSSTQLEMALWHLGNAYLASGESGNGKVSISELLRQWDELGNKLPFSKNVLIQPPPVLETANKRRKINKLLGESDVKVSTVLQVGVRA